MKFIQTSLLTLFLTVMSIFKRFNSEYFTGKSVSKFKFSIQPFEIENPEYGSFLYSFKEKKAVKVFTRLKNKSNSLNQEKISTNNLSSNSIKTNKGKKLQTNGILDHIKNYYKNCTYYLKAIPLVNNDDYKSKTPVLIPLELKFSNYFLRIKVDDVEEEKEVEAFNKTTDKVAEPADEGNLLEFKSKIHLRNFYFFENNVFFKLRNFSHRIFKDKGIQKYIESWEPYIIDLRSKFPEDLLDSGIIVFRKKLNKKTNSQEEIAYILLNDNDNSNNNDSVLLFGKHLFTNYKRYIFHHARDLLDSQIVLPNQKFLVNYYTEKYDSDPSQKGYANFEEYGLIIRPKENCTDASDSIYSINWDQFITCNPTTKSDKEYMDKHIAPVEDLNCCAEYLVDWNGMVRREVICSANSLKAGRCQIELKILKNTIFNYCIQRQTNNLFQNMIYNNYTEPNKTSVSVNDKEYHFCNPPKPSLEELVDRFFSEMKKSILQPVTEPNTTNATASKVLSPKKEDKPVYLSYYENGFYKEKFPPLKRLSLIRLMYNIRKYPKNIANLLIKKYNEKMVKYFIEKLPEYIKEIKNITNEKIDEIIKINKILYHPHLHKEASEGIYEENNVHDKDKKRLKNTGKDEDHCDDDEGKKTDIKTEFVDHLSDSKGLIKTTYDRRKDKENYWDTSDSEVERDELSLPSIAIHLLKENNVYKNVNENNKFTYAINDNNSSFKPMKDQFGVVCNQRVKEGKEQNFASCWRKAMSWVNVLLDSNELTIQDEIFNKNNTIDKNCVKKGYKLCLSSLKQKYKLMSQDRIKIVCKAIVKNYEGATEQGKKKVEEAINKENKEKEKEEKAGTGEEKKSKDSTDDKKDPSQPSISTDEKKSDNASPASDTPTTPTSDNNIEKTPGENKGEVTPQSPGSEVTPTSEPTIPASKPDTKPDSKPENKPGSIKSEDKSSGNCLKFPFDPNNPEDLKRIEKLEKKEDEKNQLKQEKEGDKLKGGSNDGSVKEPDLSSLGKLDETPKKPKAKKSKSKKPQSGKASDDKTEPATKPSSESSIESIKSPSTSDETSDTPSDFSDKFSLSKKNPGSAWDLKSKPFVGTGPGKADSLEEDDSEKIKDNSGLTIDKDENKKSEDDSKPTSDKSKETKTKDTSDETPKTQEDSSKSEKESSNKNDADGDKKGTKEENKKEEKPVIEPKVTTDKIKSESEENNKAQDKSPETFEEVHGDDINDNEISIGNDLSKEKKPSDTPKSETGKDKDSNSKNDDVSGSQKSTDSDKTDKDKSSQESIVKEMLSRDEDLDIDDVDPVVLYYIDTYMFSKHNRPQKMPRYSKAKRKGKRAEFVRELIKDANSYHNCEEWVKMVD